MIVSPSYINLLTSLWLKFILFYCTNKIIFMPCLFQKVFGIITFYLSGFMTCKDIRREVSEGRCLSSRSHDYLTTNLWTLMLDGFILVPLSSDLESPRIHINFSVRAIFLMPYHVRCAGLFVMCQYLVHVLCMFIFSIFQVLIMKNISKFGCV